MAWENVVQIPIRSIVSVTFDTNTYNYRLYNSGSNTKAGAVFTVYQDTGSFGDSYQLSAGQSVTLTKFSPPSFRGDVSGAIDDGLGVMSGVYVQRELKYTPPTNTAPTTPGVFTQPTGELEIGDSKTISWGSSSDAQGNFSKYVLEASINNGAWGVIGQPTNPNSPYTIPTASTIKFRVKAVDASGLQSAYRESGVFTVTKPKYYWSKYNSKSNYSYSYSLSWTEIGTQTANPKGSLTYSFSSSTGSIQTTGSENHIITRQYENNGRSVYTTNGDGTLNRYTIDMARNTTVIYKSKVTENSTFTGYSRGTLIQSGIIAEEGTYPNDGRHSDGYWYVKGSRVNQSIAPPQPFAAPAAGTVFKPSEVANIAIGASTAPNLSLYEFEYRHNTNAWVAMAANNTLTRTLAITTDKTLTTLQFRARAKNTSNVYSDYIYSDVYEIQHNTKPTITLNTPNNLELSESVGQNELLVDGFTKDSDQGNVLVVKVQINDGTIRNIKSEISDGNTAIFFNTLLTYSEKKIFDGATPITNELAEDVDHKLKVWSWDGTIDSLIEERTFRVVHNRPPVLSDTDRDLGTIIESPSISYQLDDLEGHAITVTEKINGKVIRTFDAEPNTDYILEIPLEMWIPLQLEQHTLTVEAVDSQGLKSVRTYTFTRDEDTILLELKNPFETDIAATRILVTPEVYIPIGASIIIEACNNAFDDEPTWEDITSMAMGKRGFSFINIAKTAEQWGINIRFTLNKGTATQEVRLDGFGGAFE